MRAGLKYEDHDCAECLNLGRRVATYGCVSEPLNFRYLCEPHYWQAVHAPIKSLTPRISSIINRNTTINPTGGSDDIQGR